MLTAASGAPTPPQTASPAQAGPGDRRSAPADQATAQIRRFWRGADDQANDQDADHIGGSARGYQELSALLATSTGDEQQAARPYFYALPALSVNARSCRDEGVLNWAESPVSRSGPPSS